MKNYEKPYMEILLFETGSIVSTSSGLVVGDETKEDSGTAGGFGF